MASKDDEYDVNPIESSQSRCKVAAPTQSILAKTWTKSCSFASNLWVWTQRKLPLAHKVYGDLVPDVHFDRQVGEDSATESREPLLVYVMKRVRGVSRLDFILAKGFPEDTPNNVLWRKNLVHDVARFFSLAWKSPQEVSQSYQDHLFDTYQRDLQLLLTALPERFHKVIRHTIESLPRVFQLPMTLVHKDFGECNIMVDESDSHLVAVIDWAEAEIAPFGTNLCSLQDFASKLHLRNGWIRYKDYDDLVKEFWSAFTTETGVKDEDTIKAIKTARVENESGRYNLMILDGLLLNPPTRFEDLDI